MSTKADPVEIHNLLESYLDFGKEEAINEVFKGISDIEKKFSINETKKTPKKKLTESTIKQADQIDQISSDLMRLSKKWEFLSRPAKEDLGMPSLTYAIEGLEEELNSFLKRIKKDYEKFGI